MKFSAEIVCVNCQHKQREMFSLDELPLQKQYAEAVKLIEEMAGELKSYVDCYEGENSSGQRLLDKYKQWKAGA